MALAVLELVHPTWSGGTVAEAVSAAGTAWVPLHVALMCGYGLLTWVLWRSVRAWSPANRHPTAARAHVAALAVLALASTTFLAVDGLVVGLRAGTDPAGANALWGSPAVTLVADVTGATWCLVVLTLAAVVYPAKLARSSVVLLALTWFTFAASATALQPSPLLNHAVAVATAAWVAYRGGPPALPSALLAFAAVLHQHVGPEAALGLVCVAVALGLSARRVGQLGI